MSFRSPTNSTNVRKYEGPGSAVLAAIAWLAFAGLLAASGAVATLGTDIPILAGAATGVALLAYAVDAELRDALRSAPVGLTLAIAVATTAASTCHPAALLAFTPVAAVCWVAAASRVRATRLSSAPVASPGARPGAL